MNGRLIARILMAILLIAVLAGFGVMIYNAGVARGLATSTDFPGPVPDGTPGAPGVPGRWVNPYYGYGYGPFIRPWGFGFFPFGFLFPLLFFFLIFWLIRGLFWRGWGGPRYYGWGGPNQVPPPFEEWHRRAHEGEANRSEDTPRQ